MKRKTLVIAICLVCSACYIARCSIARNNLSDGSSVSSSTKRASFPGVDLFLNEICSESIYSARGYSTGRIWRYVPTSINLAIKEIKSEEGMVYFKNAAARKENKNEPVESQRHAGDR